MELDIKIKDTIKRVKLLSENNRILKFQVNDAIYELDVRRTSHNIYSIINGYNSYNIEIAIDKNNPRIYLVNCKLNNMTAVVQDAQTRYAKRRNKGGMGDESNIIATPMPGKVVNILVKEGDVVEEKQTLIIVEAMKMQSEYKAGSNKKVKRILVKPGDTISGNQPLIILE